MKNKLTHCTCLTWTRSLTSLVSLFHSAHPQEEHPVASRIISSCKKSILSPAVFKISCSYDPTLFHVQPNLQTHVPCRKAAAPFLRRVFISFRPRSQLCRPSLRRTRSKFGVNSEGDGAGINSRPQHASSRPGTPAVDVTTATAKSESWLGRLRQWCNNLSQPKLQKNSVAFLC